MIDSAFHRGRNLLRGVFIASVKYPRLIVVFVVAMLVGGTTAWALATLGPDAARLPVRTVLQEVEPKATLLSGGLGAATLNLYRSDFTRDPDTPEMLLERLGIDDLQAAQFLRTDPLAYQALFVRSGRPVRAQIMDNRYLGELSVRWSDDNSGSFQRLVIQRGAAGFSSRMELAPLVAGARLASGVIQTSLFAATDEAGLSDAVAIQLAELFSGDIDFRRVLRKNDSFSVVYEVFEGDGEILRIGRVLSAEFVNSGKVFQAMWFQPPKEDQAGQPHRGAYYSLDGRSLQRTFLSTPVAFSRISSVFAMRLHPILKKWTKHQGTDFAAPIGTPVRSVADGVASFVGVQKGYGNVIFIKHRDATETVYAHLSKIMVKRGQRLNQGDIIGLVGATGWATGPHLHFEVRVRGVQKDPMLMAKKSEIMLLPASARPLFNQVASQVKTQLQAATSIRLAGFD